MVDEITPWSVTGPLVATPLLQLIERLDGKVGNWLNRITLEFRLAAGHRPFPSSTFPS